jgi:DNA-binding LacI/PurR family transcriptional regulator
MDRRPRVGIRDVAEAAGVSKSTASRALRGESRVSEETIAHVERIAASLGYVPDLRAAGLSSTAPTAVGLMLRGAERSFYGEIAARVQTATDERGMDLLIVNGGDDYESQLRGLRNLIGHRVAGVLIASGRASLAAAEEAASFLPTVLVGIDAQHEAIDSVSIAPESETEMAHAVLAAGHRRVAVTSADRPESTVLVARAERYRAGLLAGGAEVVGIPSATEVDRFAQGLRVAVDDGATAFMALGDSTAVVALELLAEWGVPNPDRLSVTGFDGVGLFASPLIGLSTMRQPVGEMANAAADLMMARIAGETGSAQHLTFVGERIAGRTLGSGG